MKCIVLLLSWITWTFFFAKMLDISIGGATSTTVVIPEGVAARISHSGGHNAMNVDLSRFPKVGKLYQSPDFDTATNKVDLTIEGGVSRIEVQ